MLTIISYLTSRQDHSSVAKLSRLLTNISLLMIIANSAFCQQKSLPFPEIGQYIDDYAKSISTAHQSFLDWRSSIAGQPSMDLLPAYKAVHDRYVGTLFPDRKFITIDNETVAPIKGRITIVNFWFLSCAPCMAEIEGFNKLAQLFSDKNVDILTITFDDPATIEKYFLRGRKMAFKIISMPKNEIKAIADMKGYPTTLILDQQGYIRYWSTGNYPEPDKAVISLLWNVGTATAQLLSGKTGID